VRKRFSDGRGAARVDKDGDLNPSFPRPPGQASTSSALFGHRSSTTKEQEDLDEDEFEDALDGDGVQEDRNEAWRFLLAGGIAGAGKHGFSTE
jgi:solute carrier family 25 phosphate transporter 23/24/25/41